MFIIFKSFQYAETRLKAALTEHHMEYKYFKARLEEAHILLDNVVLSQLAVYEPRTFKTLVDLCKKLSEEQGLAMISDAGELDYVTTSQDLHGEPYLKPKYYPKGPSNNHTTRPRKLKEEEY
uniref:Mitochondrial ribosomal protein L20 n=1 Tax=Panagrolaimus sp. JU765 TaxID=591449 RepID=A0AC34Q3N7_9BILA